MTDRLAGTKFAVFALVCALGAAWLIMVTGNYRVFPSTHDYSAELTDATGLRVGDDVRVAGVRVGRVDGVDIERGVAVVDFSLDDDVAVRDTWETGLRWRNVIGQRYLYLYPGGEGAVLEPGDRLPAARSRPHADVTEFFNRVTPLLRAIDPVHQNVVVEALSEALDGREERTQELVDSLGSLSTTLAAREPEIRSLIGDATALLSAYAERDAEIDAFLRDFADVSSTVAGRNDELVGAVTDIAEVQEEFADLLERNDAEIRTLLDDLDRVTAVVGEHRQAFEAFLETSRMGFATYMNISRRGQWFDVRGVAAQVQTSDGAVLLCTVEDGSACDVGNPPAAGQETSARSDALESLVGTSMHAPDDGETGAGAQR